MRFAVLLALALSVAAASPAAAARVAAPLAEGPLVTRNPAVVCFAPRALPEAQAAARAGDRARVKRVGCTRLPGGLKVEPLDGVRTREGAMRARIHARGGVHAWTLWIGAADVLSWAHLGSFSSRTAAVGRLNELKRQGWKLTITEGPRYPDGRIHLFLGPAPAATLVRDCRALLRSAAARGPQPICVPLAGR